MEKLAIFGGERTVKDAPQELFKWPIITEEEEVAVLDILRKGRMSEIDVTMKFEQEFENFAAKRYEENDAFFVKMFTDSGVMKSIVDMLKPIIYRKMRKKK